MKKRIYKYISMLIIVALLLPTVVLAFEQDEYFNLNNYEHMLMGQSSTEEVYCDYEECSEIEYPEYDRQKTMEPPDVFNVNYTPGVAHVGYIFRLEENARFSFAENENIRTIYAPENVFVATTIEDIISFVDPEFIVHIEPDYIIYRDHISPSSTLDFPVFAPHAFAPTDDPRYREQWNLELIRGAAAWSTTPSLRPSGIVVAVIDSGIYREHADLNSANILPGLNFAVSSCEWHGICYACQQGIARWRYDVADESGHGTAVTGVITATRGNNIGIASMACGVTILPLRVFTGVGDYERTVTSAVASAIRHATSQGAQIINMSLSSGILSEEVERAVNDAAIQGIWMIATVGNLGGTAVRYPAGLDNAIGVGAVTHDGQRWSFSQQNHSVFVVAPGERILTLCNGRVDCITTGCDGNYHFATGTSFAAPHITALAAIARAHSPNMSVDRFRNLLRASAIPRGGAGWNARNNQYGYGIVDVGLFMHHLTGRDFFDFVDIRTPVLAQPHWARNDINENARYGLMHGRTPTYTHGGANSSQTLFFPDLDMWRLEFPMALGRLYELSGENIRWENATFTDANHNALFPHNYSRYVNWAQTNGIVLGIGYNLFGSSSAVTREAAAVMFYRFTHLREQNCRIARRQLAFSKTPAFNPERILRGHFPNDYTEVSDWAQRELAWAVSIGLLRGRDDKLAPGASITRAEGATLLARYRREVMENTFSLGLIAGQDGNQGGTIVRRENPLHFALGGTASHPTSPAAIEPANVVVDDNISYLLSWFHGGDFANGPVRQGYEFKGWYLDASFNQPLTNETTMPATAITLHARWKSASVLVNSWEELRAAVNNASANVPTTILISNHIAAPAAASAINIPANRNIILQSNQRLSIRNLDMLTQGQRHFTVSGRLTLGDRVVLRGGTAITNTNNAGGVQVNAGGTLTMLNNSTIQWVNRTGTALANFGGAVNLLGSGTAVGTRATLIMDGGTIQGNSAVSGGGVAAGTNAYIDMRSGNILNNRATGTAAANGGGGVFLNAGTFTLSGGIIGVSGILTTGNRAHRGGGLRISGGTFRMTGGRISGNHASDTAIAGGGGGIFQSGGTVNISAGNIENNTAPNGGGVRVTTTAANAFTMTGGGFSSNRATSLTGDGGAIFAGTTTLTANPLPAGVISLPMLNIGADVRFTWNRAGRGASFAPTNAITATRIQTTSSSIREANHPLNNQDINYWGGVINPVPVWVEVLRSCCPVFSTGFTPAVGAVVQVFNQTHLVSSVAVGSNGRALVQRAPHLDIRAFYHAYCPDLHRPFVEVADSVAADGTIRIYFAPCHRRSLDMEEDYDEMPQ